MILLLLSALSWAQMEVCAGLYDNEQLLVELDGVDAALRDLDVDGAREQMKGVHKRLLCLEEPVDPLGLGRFARQLSVAFFFDQDEDAMLRWGRLTRTVAPDLPWPADLDPEHPLRAALEARPQPKAARNPLALSVPKKAVLYLNGSPIADSEVAIETPGLGQLEDKGDWRVWWQDGSAFPEDLLGEPGSEPELPKKSDAVAGDPRHLEQAALALFSAPVEVPEGPAPELVVDEADVALATAEQAPGTYTDPFESARRRAIRRVVFERQSTNEAGDTITKTIEVVTLAREDRSEGKPVTGQIWEYWLKDWPDWKPAAALEAGRADDTYLSDWVDGHPAPNRSRAPLVYVPHRAAAAYCASFDKQLPPVDAAFDDALDWEWRARGAEVVRVNPKGRVRVEKQASAAYDDTGFRCVDPG